MKRIIGLSGVSFFLAVVMQPAAAYAEKIAVVDVERVIQEYEAARMAESRLEERAKQFTAENEEMLREYDDMRREFEGLREESLDPALTEEARRNRRITAEEKMQQITEHEQKIRGTNAERRRQLEDQRRRVFASLLDAVRATIARQAEQDGWTLVLDASVVRGSIGAVLYHQPAHDITDQVIQRLNAGVNVSQGVPGEADVPVAE